MESQESRMRQSSIFMVPEHLYREPTGFSTTFAHKPESDTRLGGKHKVQYENTYQLEPTSAFKPEAVRSVAEHTLCAHLEGQSYDGTKAGDLCKTISSDIKRKVRAMGFNRYRLVVLTTIGQQQGQGVSVGSRCVWDERRDGFATASFQGPGLYAVAQVYAVYKD